MRSGIAVFVASIFTIFMVQNGTTGLMGGDGVFARGFRRGGRFLWPFTNDDNVRNVVTAVYVLAYITLTGAAIVETWALPRKTVDPDVRQLAAIGIGAFMAGAAKLLSR